MRDLSSLYAQTEGAAILYTDKYNRDGAVA